MKYNIFIELSPTYESVVGLETEERHPNLWQEYIVHGDMKKAVEKICETVEWEDNDKRRSFWVHGAYGTGKSYAAIVLKHLFEDKVSNIENFLSKQALAPFKKRFLNVRQKGAYLVAWKSGATDIRSGTNLMTEMEVIIKAKLKEKFGDKAYYGTSSLIDAAKEAINNKIINWNYAFDNPLYGLSDKYNALEDFRNAVMDGNHDAINKVKKICDDQHFSMFTGTVERFEAWIKDVIDGNDLKDTGIVFIWDEFTGYIRENGDEGILQRLSEFCKSVDSSGNTKPTAPFFMFLIVHRDPTWVNQLGEATYDKIKHRYHELEFHITESAAYDLIGDSIIPRTGYMKEWEYKKKDLLGSIEKYKSEFDYLEQGINIYERMNKLCPLHPMTVSMLAIVAQNFGANERTLFRFMKDKAEASENVGFAHYINTQGPDEWYWLTADYLWDYFFTRKSDVRDFNAEVKKVIQHYENKKESVSDEYAQHVFKAALLLITVMSGSNVSNLYSIQNSSRRRIGATKNILYKVFRGQLDESQIDNYLGSFEEISILRLDKQPNGDARLELPYTGNADVFDFRLEMTKKKYTRHMLFSKDKDGVFSKTLVGDAKSSYLWEVTKATYGRMYIAACSAEKTSFPARLGEVKDELAKSPYKIGLLVVSVTIASDYATMQTQIKQTAAEDSTGRLVIALLKEPCTDEIIDRWHRAITHKDISAEEGKSVSSSQYESEALAEIVKWCTTASEGQIYACCGNTQFSLLYGKSDLIKCIETNVLYSIFPAAPEKLVTIYTAFNKCTDSAVFFGITKRFLDNKKNQQIANIGNSLETLGAWDIPDLDSLVKLQGNNVIVVTELAKYIQNEFAQGAKISLDDLWSTLQQPPFGYYNTLAVGCFIGLVLRSFVNGQFNWLDASNNTFLPTAENLAKMVSSMMAGNTLNNYLASGSAIWRQFKPYAKSIFGLSDRESVSDVETRKYIQVNINNIGVPFWVLKCMPPDRFGGDDSKAVVIELTNLFCDFIYNNSSDQENVMSEIVSLFNGRGVLRKTITDLLTDKSAMFVAFKAFLFSTSSELDDLTKKLSLTDKDLLDALRVYLQDAIHTWQEWQVAAKIVDFVNELKIIDLLNIALGVNKKSYKTLQAELNNVFENMKIPGIVIENTSYSWISAMKTMRHISRTALTDLLDTDGLFAVLEKDAKTVWDALSQPKHILETLLNKRGSTCREDEMHKIYSELRPLVYETPVTAFNAELDRLLDDISYNRNAKEVKHLWKNKTNSVSVHEWCNSANIPIAWLFDSADIVNIATITAVQDSKIVDKNALESALLFLKQNNLDILQDTKVISDRFFANIGDGYRAAFESHSKTLFDRLRTNHKLTYDVYSWAGKIPEIRTEIDKYLQDKYQNEAKKHIKSMSIDELRDAALKLLEENPQLYSYFLKE